MCWLYFCDKAPSLAYKLYHQMCQLLPLRLGKQRLRAEDQGKLLIITHKELNYCLEEPQTQA